MRVLPVGKVNVDRGSIRVTRSNEGLGRLGHAFPTFSSSHGMTVSVYGGVEVYKE